MIDRAEDRTQADDDGRTLESIFRQIVDSIPVPVAVTTPTGEVETVNGPTLEYFGKTLKELKGWKGSEVVHPDDVERTIAAQMEAHEKGRAYNIESRHRRADGVYRWFNVLGLPLRNAQGEIISWFHLQIDIDDRKRGETFSKESEQRFRAIFDEAGTGITLLDLAGGPIQNNRALQRMLDCTEEELARAETFDRLTCEADREADARTFRELCEGQHDTIRIEKHFIVKHGRTVWANVIFTLLRDDDGRPRYVIAIHEDITERKLALEKLQANQQLLDLAQKSAGAMAFDWYIQEDINSWSAEQEALFGLAPGTFDGTYKTWKSMMYASDWPTVVEAIQHAHQTGTVEAEYRVVWPDGSLHWLSTNGRMFFDNEGNPLRMVGFTSDVTRRKLVEEDLKRSEAFLAEGQYLAKTGNFSWHVATQDITWSEQMYRIFGFDPGTPVTVELIASRVHPDDMPLLYEMVERAESGASDFEYEHRILMPDNSVKHLHLIAHGNHDNHGRFVYIGAVQDVTQRRLSEEALTTARSELAHAARVMSLGVLTASIAHEVNQPLSGILTNASTCVRMLDADPPNVNGARETARRTIRDGQRASDVITRLRALFGKKDGTTESIDLNEATQEVLALSRTELQRGQVTVQTLLAVDLPPVIGDRVQLQQVILNLVLNASDAMSAVDDRLRRMTIKTERDDDDKVRLSVEDNGIGLQTESLKQLFDAFYTTKSSGMGIGLSISRSIIEGHQGQIGAVPNDGPGATFYFSIPCAFPGASVEPGMGAASQDDQRVGRTFK